MVLGLLPEGYVVYVTHVPNGTTEVAYMNGSLLFFVGFQDAKNAAEDYIASFVNDNVPPPPYVWISPVYKLWVDGES